ncbi:putative RidA family protein [Paratrimastix pyriformis]|uniref:RidA family protein n=1 Tax=Paratrimastix pyriformis TaxID=342808 RepID=A0ABQ8UC34_9EUKA|nr:putative RidA family protein [Paratrimastix pyriformis]
MQTFQVGATVGPYSAAKRIGNTLFVSGQIGINPETKTLATGFADQARQALRNLGNILRAAGTDYAHVAKCNCFLTEQTDLAQMNEIYKEFFVSDFPARAAVVVKGLPAGAIFEIECVAYCP